MRTYSKEDIVNDLKKIGVKEGDLLNVKVSYKSIGKVEGGVNAVIDALLEAVGPEGTIFSDSFVSAFPRWKLIFTPKKCIVDETTKSYPDSCSQCDDFISNAKRSHSPNTEVCSYRKRF